jgi:hypothetical protein
MGAQYHERTRLRACGLFVNSQLARRGGSLKRQWRAAFLGNGAGTIAVLMLCSTPPHSSSFQPIPAKVRSWTKPWLEWA